MRLLPVEGHPRQAPAALWNTCGAPRTSCAKPSICLSRRSGVPSALGHIGCCSATGLVADTSRAEPADQHGPVRKDTHQLFRGRIQRWSTQVVLIVCHWLRVLTPSSSMDHSCCLFVTSLLAHAGLRIVQYFLFFASSSRHSVNFFTRQARRFPLFPLSVGVGCDHFFRWKRGQKHVLDTRRSCDSLREHGDSFDNSHSVPFS